MKIKLLLVGRTVESYLREGIAVYVGRLSHYASFEIVEIPDLKGTSALSHDMVKEREGESILKYVRSSDNLILLDERGEKFSSLLWARHLERMMSHSSRDTVFAIGGCYGFSEKVYQRADSMLSLSQMTFSHQMVRLIFIEQLYRAFTIIRGEPYHHQ